MTDAIPPLYWDEKDPNEVATYTMDFSGDIAAGDTIATASFTFNVPAGLTKLDEGGDGGSLASVRLSGGTAGHTAVITGTITTTTGDVFEKTAYLPIEETYVEPPALTGYTVPVAANLKAMFPAFASVPASTINAYIVRGNRMVDTTWTEGDFAYAIMLLACHYMVTAGLGTGAAAQAAAQGLEGFRVIRSASLTLERGGGSALGGASGVPEEYAGSTYGQQFWALLRRNRPRAAVAMGFAGIDAGDVPYWPPLWPYNRL